MDLTIKWEVSVQEAEAILAAMQELPMKVIAGTHARLWQSSKEQYEAAEKAKADDEVKPVSEEPAASN